MARHDDINWEGVFEDFFGHKAPKPDYSEFFDAEHEGQKRRYYGKPETKPDWKADFSKGNTEQRARASFDAFYGRPARTAPTFDNTVGKEVCLARDVTPRSVLRFYHLMPHPEWARYRNHVFAQPVAIIPETPPFTEHMENCPDCAESGLCPIGETFLRNVTRTVIKL